MAAAGAGGSEAAAEYFKPENVFLVAGHGGDTGRRFELREGQYGAIPTTCGAPISYNFSHFNNFFTKQSKASKEILIPGKGVSLKDITKSINPKAYMKTLANAKIQKAYKIYRPKLDGNTEYTKARWTMPELEIGIFSFWSSQPFSFKVYLRDGELERTTGARAKIGFSGVFPSISQPKFEFRDDQTDSKVPPELRGYSVIPLYELSSFDLKLDDIYNKPQKYITEDFFERLQESMKSSFLTFDDVILITWLNKVTQARAGYIHYIKFSEFKALADDETTKDIMLSVAKKELSLGDLVYSLIPLSFIYEYISNKVHDPFIIIAPVCRELPKAMTSREKAKVRRFSRNFSGNILSAAAAAPSAAQSSEGGSRRRTRRAKRRLK
jgi:hypothetical protein